MKRDNDLDDELRAHLRMAIEDRIRRGESPRDAERNARREFGNELLVRETTRDMWAWSAWERLAQDLRYSMRGMLTNKVFTLVVVLTLALGVGVNTAIFTLVHAVMFNTLPVSRPGELYRLGAGDNCCVMTGYQNGQHFGLFSWELYKTLREGTPEITHLAAFKASTEMMTVRREGNSESGASFTAEYVSGNYFALFGIRPALGGFFNAGDDIRGNTPTLVLSYRAWQTWLGGDSGVIGSRLIVKGKPFTVVGVAPQGFYGETLRSNPPDCWLPAAAEPLFAGDNSLFNRPAKMWLYLMGRVRPGVALRSLETKINVETRRWYFAQAGAAPSRKTRQAIEDQFVALTAASGGVETMSIAYRNGLVLLMSLSSLVLLIACANVANLLLARGTALRARNSLKVALGASRSRMIRHALTDSLILALSGGAVGLALATGATKLIVLLAFRAARYVPIDATPSPVILGFAIAVSLLTGLMFGIGPALIDTRVDPADALRGARSSPQATTLPQRLLVIAQAALSFVLLTGAGLLTENLRNLQHQNLGFRADRRVLVQVNPDFKDYTPDRLTGTYRILQDRLSRLPGVTSVGLAMYLPMTGNNWNTSVWVEGGGAAPLPEGISYDRVSSGYFEAVGTRLLRGRSFAETDGLSSRRVVLVNQTFVARYAKGRDPIGMRFGGDGPEHPADYEVVGVVEDAKYEGPHRPAHPMFFLALLQPELNQKGSLSMDSVIGGIVLQVNGAGSGLEPLLRKTIPGVDSGLGIVEIRTYQEQLAIQFNKERLLATLTQLFGVLALALASVGLYGLVSLAGARRKAEIGVRMALGATRSRVIAMILRGALEQVVIGIAIGVPLSLAGARWLEHQLFGVSARDPLTMAAASIVLVACATVAAMIPASRATKGDLVRALRAE